MAPFRRAKPPAASGLLALALGEAEDGLELLPLTEEVRRLQARHVALRTVYLGMLSGIPRLTVAQRSRFVVAALTHASDVTRMRARWGS